MSAAPPTPQSMSYRMAMLVTVALYLAAVIFSVWLCNYYHWGGSYFASLDRGIALGPFQGLVLGAIVTPLLGLALAAMMPDRFRLGPRRAGAFQMPVGQLLLIPGASLVFRGPAMPALVFPPAIYLVALAGGVILTFILYRLKDGISVLLFVLILTSLYVGGAVRHLNHMFDDSPPLRVIAQVKPERDSSGRWQSIRVRLDPPGPHGATRVTYSTRLDHDRYSDGICLRMYRGALFLGWYTMEAYGDCPQSVKLQSAPDQQPGVAYRPRADVRTDRLPYSMSQRCAGGNQQACLNKSTIEAGGSVTEAAMTELANEDQAAAPSPTPRVAGIRLYAPGQERPAYPRL